MEFVSVVVLFPACTHKPRPPGSCVQFVRRSIRAVFTWDSTGESYEKTSHCEPTRVPAVRERGTERPRTGTGARDTMTESEVHTEASASLAPMAPWTVMSYGTNLEPVNSFHMKLNRYVSAATTNPGENSCEPQVRARGPKGVECELLSHEPGKATG